MSHLPLVLLGGTLCDERLWQPVVDKLNHPQIIVKRTEGGDSATACADHLLAQLPEKFCLAGFSLGAVVALHMLAAAPQRIAGLALLAVNPFPLSEQSIASRRTALAQALKYQLREYIETQLWQHYVAPARVNDSALRETILAMAECCGVEAFINQSELSLLREDCREAVQKYPRPLLLLSGDSDTLCPAEGHYALSMLAPHASWHQICGCGHFLPLEAPEQCASAIEHWLQEVAYPQG